MLPSPRPHAVLLAAVLTVSACSSGQAAGTSFDPNSTCTSDGRFAGAYPALEALVPRTYRGDPPGSLDSGRNCTAAKLGSLVDSGIKDVEFAGGTWSFGAERALVMAVFRANGLDADKIAAFYAAGAAANSRTTIVSQTTPTVAGRPGHRLDTTNPSEQSQTIVTWPSSQPNMVNVVITNDLPDARIQDAIDAFGGR
jgi:hypothetical protein